MSIGFAEFLTPLLVIIVLFLIVYGIFYLRSRENMALIAKGINPRQNDTTPKPYISLKYGLLMLGGGLGLILGYIIDVVILKHGTVITHNGGSTDIIQTNDPSIYFALLAIGGGIGLIISYRMEKKVWLDKNRRE